MFAVRHPLLSVPRRGLVVRFISSKTTAPAQAASLSTIDALSPREGLPRWPNLTSPTGCLRSLDWFGTAVFAVSGSLTAVTSGCDLFGSVLVGTITATGGGTLRDALVLNKSPFWVEEWEYLVLSAAAAAGTFYLWGQLSPGKEIIEGSGMTLKSADGGEGTLLDWGDAIGIGAFAVIGAMNGIRAQCPLLVSSICGMMTATFGGMTRDTLLNRPVRILHPYADTYAPVAFTTATAYLAMRGIAPRLQGIRIASCVALGVAMRQQASTHGWRFPHWDLKGSQSVVYSSVDPRIQES
ncbi:unnamed protein product [Aphanomyces euteiches]|uniref:Glycine transporter domain-containing protein n=1 Tax=Aphanomyces euteiches TaxID=100861 RepID=A0A6G0WP54_9STRA|nr:hypothetical protein Ae201684_013145 [Aphanomyces euteiches]KAH9076623.1 hypothetical protein Ae201684P_010563 [Aphanomyces euteiches]KAH9156414.1 hypothetical protein AeRB84_001696 [Aphanomyces euteiches]